VSQDLLKRNGGPLDYGDLLYVEGLGFRFVNDVMNQRHKRRLDIWVLTAKQEKEFKEGNRQVFLVHSIPKGK
jgi:3D (Asp-Asp-Asp) domain-containing protein